MCIRDRINVGVLALAVGVIAVRVFGLNDKVLIGAISSSMLATLVGITLLFAIINSTGALDLMARKIVALAGNHTYIIPVSYTHLDVYKRQSIYRPVFVLQED